MNFEKIILVTRKTRLEGLVERFNTVGQARFYLEHSGGNFELYQQEHDIYYLAVERLRSDLQELAKFQEIERGFLPNFLFSEKDIVVTIGIDGLVILGISGTNDFSKVTLTQKGGDTLVAAGGKDFALLSGVQSNTLTSSSFKFA